MHLFHRPLFTRVFGALSILFFCAGIPLAHASDTGKIVWLHAEADAFAKARAQHRFVLLDLEAVWCHWCHVMDEQTYANAEVAAEISAHYIALRIDQDSRPDIANRYGDFGWPATVVFASDGTEIVKRRGYIEAPRFLSMLKAIVVDPSPIVVATGDTAAMPTQHDSALDATTRDELLARYRDTYDHKLGSLPATQKFLDYDSIEFAIVHGQRRCRRNRDGAADVRCRARIGRSGLGRRISILHRWRWVASAGRETRHVAGVILAHLRTGVGGVRQRAG